MHRSVFSHSRRDILLEGSDEMMSVCPKHAVSSSAVRSHFSFIGVHITPTGEVDNWKAIPVNRIDSETPIGLFPAMRR